MQVTSERSDNVKHVSNVEHTEGFVTDTLTNTDTETAKAVMVAQANIVKQLNELTSHVSDTRTEIFDKSASDSFYLNELRKSVDNFAKVQYAHAIVALCCFACLFTIALVVVLSLAFL